MTTPQLIETARLRLSPLAPGDAAEFHTLMIEPGVRRYLCDDQIMPREWADEVIAGSDANFAAHGWGLWAARERGAASLRGVAGFMEFFDPPVLQLLYALHPSVWGHGFATEASRALIGDAFDRLGFAQVVAATDPPNTASIAVMKRVGLRLVEETIKNGKPAVIYAINRDDWRP